MVTDPVSFPFAFVSWWAFLLHRQPGTVFKGPAIQRPDCLLEFQWGSNGDPKNPLVFPCCLSREWFFLDQVWGGTKWQTSFKTSRQLSESVILCLTWAEGNIPPPSTVDFLSTIESPLFRKNMRTNMLYDCMPIMWVKQYHKPSPSHHFYRWYVHHSQSWFMTLFYPYYNHYRAFEKHLHSLAFSAASEFM